MIEIDELNIPRAARAHAEQVTTVTDEVCLEHLDAEYADLCRRVVGRLARKRPTPLARGSLRIWAAGVIDAVGRVNFLFDPSRPVHLTTDHLSGALDVKKTTMANKAALIRNTLKLTHFDAELTRRALLDSNPLTWLLGVGGLIVDARRMPESLQVEASRWG